MDLGPRSLISFARSCPIPLPSTFARTFTRAGILPLPLTLTHALFARRYTDSTRVAEVRDLISCHPTASTAIPGTVRGYWPFKPLAPSVCEVTYVVQVNLGGSIPKELLALRKKQTLGLVQTVQTSYERKGSVVDAEIRAVFPSPPPLAELDDEPKAIVDSCRAMESGEEDVWETLPSPSPFVDMWVKHTPAKEYERAIAIGKATAVVDCPVRDAVGESSDRRYCVLRRLV